MPCIKHSFLTNYFRSSHRRCSIENGVLVNFAIFTGKRRCKSLFFYLKCSPKACNFIKKEILAQVFSCEFCKDFKNNFFTEHLRATASIIFLTVFGFRDEYNLYFFISRQNKINISEKIK